MANPQGQGFEDLRNTVNECLRIARHRWRLSLVGLSLVGTAAFWCSQYLPRVYMGTTMFERRDDVVLQNLIQANSPYGFEHLKTTMSLDMTGQRALAKALETAGVVPLQTFTSTQALTDRERAVLDDAVQRYRIRPNLKLLNSSSSLDTIVLSCEANDPGMARRIVVALRDNYIAETRERIREILVGTREFFSNEVTRLQQQSVGMEDELRSGFEDFPYLDPTDLVSVGNRLEMLRGQRDSLYQRKAALDADIAAREQFLRSAPGPDLRAPDGTPTLAGTVQPGSTVDVTLDRAIEGVQKEIVDLVTGRRMTMEHPAVKALYDRLNSLKELRGTLAEMAAAQTNGEPATAAAAPLSEAARQWQAQQMRVELELESLRKQLATASTQLEEADVRLERFQQLYDRLVTKDDSIRTLLGKRSEASAELAVWQSHLSRLERILTAESGERGTQFTLIEEPQDVARPTKPRVASIFAVCSGLGLAAAVLLAAVAELFDRSFRSVGQVTRALGIPVLECIGVVPTPRERRRAALGRLVWTPTLGMLLIALVASAALAYASLELPAIHARAIESVGRVLGMEGPTDWTWGDATGF